MAYGTEAVIPLEVGIPGIRTQGVENGNNDVLLARDLDLLEERREKAAIQLAAYQQQLARAYNKKVNPREFQVGDLVLRKVVGTPGRASLAQTGKDPTESLQYWAMGHVSLKIMRAKHCQDPGTLVI